MYHPWYIRTFIVFASLSCEGGNKLYEIIDQIKECFFAGRRLVSPKKTKYAHTPTIITPARIYRYYLLQVKSFTHSSSRFGKKKGANRKEKSYF